MRVFLQSVLLSNINKILYLYNIFNFNYIYIILYLYNIFLNIQRKKKHRLFFIEKESNPK